MPNIRPRPRLQTEIQLVGTLILTGHWNFEKFMEALDVLGWQFDGNIGDEVVTINKPKPANNNSDDNKYEF